MTSMKIAAAFIAGCLLTIALYSFRERNPTTIRIDEVTLAVGQDNRGNNYNIHRVKAHSSRIAFEILCEEAYGGRCFSPLAGMKYSFQRTYDGSLGFMAQPGDTQVWTVTREQTR
jgi:hypothetical protein